MSSILNAFSTGAIVAITYIGASVVLKCALDEFEETMMFTGFPKRRRKTATRRSNGVSSMRFIPLASNRKVCCMLVMFH
jgi:hypothetical protein